MVWQTSPMPDRALKNGGRIQYWVPGHRFVRNLAHLLLERPSGFISCGANPAHSRSYGGHSDEIWMNPSTPTTSGLIVDHVAARLAARPHRRAFFFRQPLGRGASATASERPVPTRPADKGALDIVASCVRR